MRKRLFPILSGLILSSSFGLPLTVVALLHAVSSSRLQQYSIWLVSPILIPALFVLIAGTWSLPFQRFIIPGKFPRDLNDPIYFGRRMYGICWTALYYCTPIYFLCLSVGPLKWFTFRLFGYRGSMNFAIYPDTWVRDLPLLKFGNGAYLSNKATIGTNIALSNGSILVDSIEFKDNSYLGHLSMVAPGAIVEESAEIGVGCSIGIKARIGPKSRIGPGSSVGHGAQVSAGVVTGAMCCIGSGTKIASGVILPNCASIPNRQSISDQSSANRRINTFPVKGTIRTSDLLHELTRFLASSEA